MPTRTLAWILAVCAVLLVGGPLVGMLVLSGGAIGGGMMGGGMMGGGMAGMHVGGFLWFIVTIVVIAALVALLVRNDTRA